MRLISVEQFARECFAEGHAPDPRTVRAWVRNRKIPGIDLGGRIMVDLDGVQKLIYTEPGERPKADRKTMFRI